MGKKMVIICLIILGTFIPLESKASTTDNQAVVSFYSEDHPGDPSGTDDSPQPGHLPQTGDLSSRGMELLGVLLFFLGFLGWGNRRRRSKSDLS